MNFWIRVFATFFIGILLLLIMPWWSIAIASFIVGSTTKRSGFTSFLSGFLGIGLLWWGYAAYVDVSTQALLTQKIASLFTLPSGLLLILITGLVGALVGGFASLTGTQFRKIFTKTPEVYYKS